MRTGENIYRRKDGRWEARVRLRDYPDGSPHYKSLYAGSYREAREKKELFTQSGAAVNREPVGTGIPLFGDEARDWLLAGKNGGWRPGTYNKYKTSLQNHILPYWDKAIYTRLNQKDYEALVLELKNCGIKSSSLSTVNTVLRSIRKFGLQNKNLPLQIIVPGNAAKASREMKILTDAERRSLTEYAMKAVTPTTMGIFLFLYEGLRLGEACALQWQDVDIPGGCLHIRKSLQRIQRENENGQFRTTLLFGPTKNGKERMIPIHPQLLPLLRQEKGEKREEFLLSGTKKPTEPRTYAYRFHKILQECGIRNVHIHLLRHTFASVCVESGMDIKALSEILGHQTIKITMDRYVHLSMQFKKEQMDVLHFPVIDRQNSGQETEIYR